MTLPSVGDRQERQKIDLLHRLMETEVLSILGPQIQRWYTTVAVSDYFCIPVITKVNNE